MATAAQAKAFIEKVAPIIQKEAKKRGYLVASPVIAQACIESAYGTSSLGNKYHNYFGMKCGSSWKGKSVNLKTKEEYTVGTLTTIRDNFRAYDSMEDGIVGYYDFISTKRYANLKTAKTAQEYLERIKADGYATSSTYVKTNMNVVTKCGLTKYDGGAVADIVKTNPYTVPTVTLKNGSKGSGVKWLQFELNERGYGLAVDGIFGKKTEEAVRSYQNKRSLVSDGICGARTRAELVAGK